MHVMLPLGLITHDHVCMASRAAEGNKEQGLLQKALQDKARLQATVQRLQSEVRALLLDAMTHVAFLPSVLHATICCQQQHFAVTEW